MEGTNNEILKELLRLAKIRTAILVAFATLAGLSILTAIVYYTEWLLKNS